MKKTIDLHVHSTYSDGSYTPSELVDLALKQNLSAFALTDHDTTDGILEAVEAAENTDLRVIGGIEFSTGYLNKDVHILGLFIDYQDIRFQEQLRNFQNSRNTRNEKIAAKLRQHQIPVTLEEITEAFPNSVCTRAHFASYLRKKGFVSSEREAFDRFLGDRAPCFVPREKVTPYQAIHLIHEFKGLAVLAHPLLYGFSARILEEFVAEMKKAGLDGIETIYSCNTASDTVFTRQLASRYQLKITGGSDFHGDSKPGLAMGTGYGNLMVPYSVLEQLEKI